MARKKTHREIKDHREDSDEKYRFKSRKKTGTTVKKGEIERLKALKLKDEKPHGYNVI